MGDKIGFAGYSPYHVTTNNGYLGSHVDHFILRMVILGM